ncbi:MAG: phosphopantetheine-binding protein [Gammaproteobacteria bacterium]
MDESPESLTPERPILEEGLLDSLALQRLVSFLESEFDIEIDDDYLLPENFESIQAITTVVEEIRQQVAG